MGSIAKFNVKLRVVGLNFMRELSKAQQIGIVVTKLKKRGVRVHEFFVSESGHAKILEHGLFANFQVEIIERHGQRELFLKLFSWVGIIFGAMFGFVLFFCGTRYVSTVEILIPKDHVCKNGSRCIFESSNFDEFEAYLETLGVHVGGEISHVDKQSAERAILAKFEGISSCSIRSVGTKLEVEVHEGVLKSDHTAETMDLIAPENGIVSELVVSSGKAMVKAGDTVKKGQVLVAGENGKRAMGSAVMRLFKHKSYIHSEISIELARTGKEKSFVQFELLGKNLSAEISDSDCGFVFFEKEESHGFIVPNLFVPMKKIVIKYYETEKKEVITAVEDVKDSIIAKLSSELEADAGISASEDRKIHTVVTEIADCVFEIDCYLEYMRVVKQ
ncbi:MAG: sporulation protein YqfD [Clostridia bacterium]|nr:sporulation protein YqfD [Clostridia bacterium]